MASQKLTRQRLIHTALKLFASQGVTATTTKQIAEAAEVNEVTLFRHFGSKHGLLLAAIEEVAIFTQLEQTLNQQANQAVDIYQALKDYATACLEIMDRVPEVVRSVVGEAGNFPAENREALGRGFNQANRYVAAYFATVINRGQLYTHLPPEKLASLLNGMLLGYAVIEFTSEFHSLWQDRNDFLENLVTLFLNGAVSPKVDLSTVSNSIAYFDSSSVSEATEIVADLSPNWVHSILKKAKKISLQDYAMAYLLFGAGLSPGEVVNLKRSHYLQDSGQILLQIMRGQQRQIPVNQWIFGKRYGSPVHNPLNQWLKSRKDNQVAFFLNQAGEPLSKDELIQHWQTWTSDLQTSEGHVPTINQAQQTWCIEMLMRGLSWENLSILTGWSIEELQPYIDRAKEKSALEEALRLDQKT